ncbi:MAG: amidohydrolase [Chloroflexi bacterium]|nr:amidohydrolase [Chloroflexota bacterium]
MLERALRIEQQLVSWRRDFHRRPELGFREVRTSKRVADELTRLGYRVRTGVGRTGVVAELGSGRPVVAVRADMDGLPIQEAADRPYASQEPGLMHACGHDAHVAIALGVATLLAEESLPGTVRFLFQPSEEAADDEGRTGASRIIEDGAMDGVDAVIALHISPMVAVGDIVVDAGPFFAGVDSFSAKIMGQGGHGAMPHTVIDPIYLSGHAILAVHGIISRRLDPTVPAVLGICTIHAGTAANIVPEEVELSGTIRFMRPEVREQLHRELDRALQVTRTLGGDYRLSIEPGCLPVENDAGVVATIQEVGAEILGQEHVLKPDRLEMGSEDFSLLSDIAPGAIFWLGCRIEGDERRLHSPAMDIDERCLPLGTSILAQSVLRLFDRSAG